jgi:hypothetical protein
MATVAAAEADATATAAASGGAARTGAAPRTVVVASFASLLPLVKRIVLKVHPDIVHAAGPEAVSVNEASVREFFRLFDTLKQRCGGDDGSGTGPGSAPLGAAPAPLKHRYDLSFFYYAPPARGVSGGHELRRANVDIAVPPLFQERTAALEGRGLAPQARSHWLGLAVDTTTKLLAAVGLGGVVRPVLAPEHQAVVDRAREQQHQQQRTGSATSGASGGRFRQADADGAMGALRRNLLSASPLVQGKGDAFPTYGMATASVYSLKQRTSRVLALLASAGRQGGGGFAPSPELSPEQARAGFTALRHTLIAHHDGLQLYHPLWPAVAVTLAPSGVWAAVPPARSLTLPWDATPEETVRFIQRAFPSLVAAAQAQVPGRLARAQQAAAAATAAARKGGGARKASPQSAGNGRPRYRMHDGTAPAEGDSWQRRAAAHRREGPRAQPPRHNRGGSGVDFDDDR